jgi:RNA 3'-terminal phosphate cyclase (ATP)
MVSVEIDGGLGEGGGQVLRSALSLAVLTGRRVRVRNVRARRDKPGLLRQHLAAARAAAAVCGGKLEGAELGSRDLTFAPGAARHGVYEFAVGSAGSTGLVLQTVLPALLGTPGTSELTLHGGTHNPSAPPYDFLEHVYFRVLRRMGVELDAALLRYGFYPAGGGCVRVRFTTPPRLRPLDLTARAQQQRVEAWALSAGLPDHVGTRELAIVREQLQLPRHAVRSRQVEASGPGNALCILVDGELPELVTAFGEAGRAAEDVATDAVRQANQYLGAVAPVGEHLADQLLLLLVLSGGAFRAPSLSAHARTNIDVIRCFLGAHAVEIEERDGTTWVRCADGGGGLL